MHPDTMLLRPVPTPPHCCGCGRPRTAQHTPTGNSSLHRTSQGSASVMSCMERLGLKTGLTMCQYNKLTAHTHDLAAWLALERVVSRGRDSIGPWNEVNTLRTAIRKVWLSTHCWHVMMACLGHSWVHCQAAHGSTRASEPTSRTQESASRIIQKVLH